MKLLLKKYLILSVVCGLAGCSTEPDIADFDPEELLAGAGTSVKIQPFASFIKPAKNLPQEKHAAFYAGKALAHQPWVKAPTVTDARDGLGPIYNARTCLACHVNGGRGRVPSDQVTQINHSFVRISVPGVDKNLGVIPDPVYGDQLQTQSIALSHQLRNVESARSLINKEPPPEAYVYLNWQSKTFTYSGGRQVELWWPSIRITQLGYGALSNDLQTSLRNAPPILGVGLIELIDQKDIAIHADPGDQDRDGISGRVNYVWDADKNQIVPGRFGLKANRPANLRTVTAAAFAGDVGISNPLFPSQPCTVNQTKCNAAPNGNNADGFELPMALLDLTTDFTRQLAVPKRTVKSLSKVRKGKRLFYAIGCHGCHVPSYITGDSKDHPNLSRQKIWPYSDFLLHDMGEGLADGRTDFEATGTEWRTPPLWGVGLSEQVNGNHRLLHDGRARNVEEAILWHGGEAQVIKDKFVDLSLEDRNLLIQFVESL